ncbi:MAG: hypothetical protein WA885_06240 [Phormidesmis sp.]
MYPSYKQTYHLRTSTLALIAFATLFFARTLDVLGAPSPINFAHFAFVPLACGFALFNTRIQDRRQISTVWTLISVLLIFFTVNLLSALLNGAGLINVILNFLLLAEPFIMLLTITSIPLSINRIKQMKNWVAIFAIYNLALAYFQRYVLGATNPDFIYGAFFSIAGATVSSIVSLIFSIYYLTSEKDKPLWMRSLPLVAAFWQIIISDTKLVLGSFIVGFILFSLSKVSSKTLIYVILGMILLWGSFWAIANIEFLEAYAIWIQPELFTNPDSEFYRAKLTAFREVPEYYDSFLSYLFGVGPGHGVGRLGGWMMEKYSYLLDPLGATHPYLEMSSDVMAAAASESRNVLGTAMYGPLFSWAGIWSDLGIVGLGSYLLVWLVVWRYYCLHDFSRYLVMATFATGLFPGYLEEPGSMLFTTFVIGLWWHEQRLSSKQKVSTSKVATLSFSKLPGNQIPGNQID